MADTTTAVNGLYGHQYGQPVELAATNPSGPTHAATASQSTIASASGAQKADAQEIGWYFVEQYYTTLSKSPERIHLFYKKKSQLVTGVEAEKVMPSVGEKAISEKIKSLDIRDCKVRVLNVDSQASFSNIVVQVIGEMSNKNKPHHKFVQTFVLAEQPNGYFVLNDIFRYLNLNEEDDEIVEDEVLQPEVPAEEPVTPADPSVEPPTEELVTSETAVEEVNNKLEDEKALEEETSAPVNGTDADESVEEAAPLEEESAQPEPEAANEPTPEPAVEQTPEPEPTVVAPPKAPEPVAETQPAKPKTWASMLGGSKPAVPALPAQSQQKAPAQPKVQKPAAQAAASKATPTEPAAASPSPTPSNGWQTAESGKKGRGPSQPKQESNVLAYIKNVNEKVDARVLREVLEKYGELKYFDVSRMRNCAFVEFATPEGYNAAIAANPHTVDSFTIIVEERRPRPNAYGGSNASFGRGANQNTRGGRGGGNMQQRQGSNTGAYPKDAPRGGMQQRGAKSGNITPRGRGQGQAV